MIHISLAVAFFKIRNQDSKYIDECNHHCIEAMKYGHSTGLAPYRLTINLEKARNIQYAIEVCQLVLDEGYEFLSSGFKQKPDFQKRLEKLLKKLDKNASTMPPLFLESEKETIFKNTKVFNKQF